MQPVFCPLGKSTFALSTPETVPCHPLSSLIHTHQIIIIIIFVNRKDMKLEILIQVWPQLYFVFCKMSLMVKPHQQGHQRVTMWLYLVIFSCWWCYMATTAWKFVLTQSFLLMSCYIRLLPGCQLLGYLMVQREASAFMLLADILFILNIFEAKVHSWSILLSIFVFSFLRISKIFLC